MSQTKDKLLKYQHLKEDIKQKIYNGVYTVGQCLPSERQLSEEYSISRMTVRRTIGELQDEGVLYRLQGKGTFISATKIMQPMSKITSFTDDMRARGMVPDAKILMLDTIPANELIAEKLQCKQGADVILLKRLRLADNEPMAIETLYLQHAICHPIIDKISQGTSIYSLLKQELHINLVKAFQSIEIMPLQKWEANMLGNDDLDSAMYIQRQTFDEQNRAVEYVESKYRGDRYKFYVEMSGA